MSERTFYITTPIYYVNDVPHIGHAYTTVCADVLARWERLRGRRVFFLTGTDEHGQKMEKAAFSKGFGVGFNSCLELADHMSEQFKSLWVKLNISNDDFIRTTEARHARAAQAFFKTIWDRGDIYKGEYEDWYCTPCETFWTETQLLSDKTCPECGRPTDKLKEESYFFRLSAYQQKLLDHIEANPDFIYPASRRAEVVSFIKSGLRDLSISRTSFKWGIPVPLDERHIIYVWFDALVNYLTAAGYPDDMEKFQQIWPADIHLMSKDILRFHAVFWPAFLMSAGFALPRRVVLHGWWTVEGQKMSKSLGNAVDPNLLADKYGVDPLRYFMLREVAFGLDGDFSQSAFIGRFNSDLANDLGNLVHRSLSMVNRYFKGIVPEPQTEMEMPGLKQKCEQTISQVEQLFQDLALHKVLIEIWDLIGATNKYIADTTPWELNKDKSKAPQLAFVIYNILEALRMIAALISPVMPATAQRIWQQLGVEEPLALLQLGELRFWGWLTPGKKIGQPEPLFPRQVQT